MRNDDILPSHPLPSILQYSNIAVKKYCKKTSARVQAHVYFIFKLWYLLKVLFFIFFLFMAASMCNNVSHYYPDCDYAGYISLIFDTPNQDVILFHAKKY